MEGSSAAADSRAGGSARRARAPGAPARVVIVGGGVAVLEAVLALAHGTRLPVRRRSSARTESQPLAHMEARGGAALTIDQIVVTSAGLLAVAGVAWFSRGRAVPASRRALTSTGVQETTIVVKGAYSPDLSVVDHGKPVRLSFLRQETAACFEEVIFPDFARRAELAWKRKRAHAPPDFRLAQALRKTTDRDR